MALLVPAAAQAADKVVTVGPPKPLAKAGAPASADDNAFYPKKVKVARGETLQFKFAGFHNVMFVPKGQDAPRLEAPDPANPISGLNDAAGNPFHFNGMPRLVVNPLAGAPAGDGKVDGSTFQNSGIPQDIATAKYALKFTGKPGSRYTLLCAIHPGMKLDVRVAERSGDVPGAKKVAKAARQQYRKAAKLATKLAKAKVKKNTIQLGSDKGTVAHFAFFPSTLTVKAGTDVTFAMSKESTEIHNVLFGPKELQDQIGQSLITPDASGALVLNPLTFYPSDAGKLPSLTKTVHGNGFLNTGAVPPSASATVTAGEAGTYRFICSIHPFMEGTLEVTP
jgi:plastocyanin